MAHWISAPAQVKALAKAVSTAFAASNLTQEEKNPGKIEITDLPWQAPPLVMEKPLSGVPLQDYLDVPVPLDEKTIYRFWTETLQQMWHTPGRLMARGALATCGRYMPKVRPGQRALRFARPAGYPAVLDETAGAMFSLEVAHAAMTSLPITRLVSDEDNYYVELFGQILGIKDGVPACESPWDHSVAGLVQELLAMPRGDTSYDCVFDQIASLRSVLHVHQKSFPRNFEVIDAALQALRLLTLDGNCPALVKEMYVAPHEVALLRANEAALRESIDVVRDPMNDRSKLQTLQSLLVPGTISAFTFRQRIFSGKNFPFTLAEGKLGKIEDWLCQEYENRIPQELRKLKGLK